jgi:hypothetical protein
MTHIHSGKRGLTPQKIYCLYLPAIANLINSRVKDSLIPIVFKVLAEFFVKLDTNVFISF